MATAHVPSAQHQPDQLLLYIRGLQLQSWPSPSTWSTHFATPPSDWSETNTANAARQQRWAVDGSQRPQSWNAGGSSWSGAEGSSWSGAGGRTEFYQQDWPLQAEQVNYVSTGPAVGVPETGYFL